MVLLKGLNEEYRKKIMDSVRAFATKSPVLLRRLFEDFGGSASRPLRAPADLSQVLHNYSPGSSSPAPHELSEATAVLELRSIILKNPKKCTRLLPSEWSRRFRSTLGTYRQFVESRSPNIFRCEVDTDSDLVVSKIADNAEEAIARFQRLADLHGKSATLSASDEPETDRQYLSLCRVADMKTRYTIVGGMEVYVNAGEALVNTVSKFPTGVDVSRCWKLLSDSGIVPVPLEWYSDKIVIPGDAIYLLKEGVSKFQSLELESSVHRLYSYVIQAINSGVPFVMPDEVCQRLGLVRSDLNSILDKSELFFHENHKVFTCERFEQLVYGYVSSRTLDTYHKSVDLARMTPVQHILQTIRKVINLLPDRRLPAEYFIAWCAALDLEPRLVLKCLRESIFFSGTVSDFQVVLRSKAGKISGLDAATMNVPGDVMQRIKNEVKSLGEACTVDKLASNLHWGKTFDNAKKYGQLKDVLQRCTDIFYDPSYLYMRESLDGLVQWPDRDHTLAGTAGAEISLELENRFTVLSSLSAMIVYHLTSTESNFYPLSHACEYLANSGLDKNELCTLDYLYVPDSIVYLRKSAPSESDDVPLSPIERAVVGALRRSRRHSLDYDGLIRALVGCSRYAIEEIDSVRSVLGTMCRNAAPEGSGLQAYCFYNPDVVILKSFAKELVAMAFSEAPIPSPVEIKRKAGIALHPSGGTVEQDDADALDTQTFTRSLQPSWCIKGAIVTLRSSPDESYEILDISDECMRLKPLVQDREIISVNSSAVRPKSPRVGDTILVLDGPYLGSLFKVVGTLATTISVQISKFEFKSLSCDQVTCIASDANRQLDAHH